MSYRALKRLLGETSLERKCRFLFGAFILLLITGSFWLYGHQTEDLAYEQITTTCRLLVNPIVQRKHAEDDHAAPKPRAAELTEGDLMAVVHIRMQTSAIESGMHLNRAILISTALVTSLLIMIGSYVIVRYVIVKPVKHLKEVSDAISAGELNVRSEIQTGDEFEDLSHAFNRMLRNLVSMQDRWRKVNADLDRKIDELARANMALYESNRLKGDFLATMSHELRTPLNSILGFSQVLQSSTGLNDKQMRWLNNIWSSGEQLLALIN